MKSKKTDEYIDDVPDNYKLVTEGTLQSGDLIFSLGSNFYNIKRGWHKVRQEDIGGTLQHLHGVCRKAESEEKMKVKIELKESDARIIQVLLSDLSKNLSQKNQEKYRRNWNAISGLSNQIFRHFYKKESERK